MDSETLNDLLELKLTLPQSKETKNLTVGEYVKTKFTLPTLVNMKAFGKLFYKYSNETDYYVENVWYIKELKITNEEAITLTLIPFREDTREDNKYKKSKTNKTNNTGNTVTSDYGDYIKTITSKAISGAKTDKAKAQNINKYVGTKKSWGAGVFGKESAQTDWTNKGFKKIWSQHTFSCGYGAYCLYVLMKSAGLNAYICHCTGHWFVRVKINGKNYYCDHSRTGGQYRPLTQNKSKSVWHSGAGTDNINITPKIVK